MIFGELFLSFFIIIIIISNNRVNIKETNYKSELSSMFYLTS